MTRLGRIFLRGTKVRVRSRWEGATKRSGKQQAGATTTEGCFRSGKSGTDLKVDRVDRAGMRRGVLFRVVAAIDIVVNVRQRATRPELISQVNVQMLAAGLRWTGASTLDGQRGLRYAGSRGTSTHRAARRGHLCRSRH